MITSSINGPFPQPISPNHLFHSALNSPVCRLEGVGRFYIGLAAHIQILEGEELKQYAAEYAEKYLKM